MGRCILNPHSPGEIEWVDYELRTYLDMAGVRQSLASNLIELRRHLFIQGLGELSTIKSDGFTVKVSGHSFWIWRNDSIRTKPDFWISFVGKHSDRPAPWPTRLLAAFAWCCGRETRPDVMAVVRNLALDFADMRSANRSKLFIYFALLTQVVSTILITVADGTWRIVKPVREIQKGLKGGGA